MQYCHQVEGEESEGQNKIKMKNTSSKYWTLYRATAQAQDDITLARVSRAFESVESAQAGKTPGQIIIKTSVPLVAGQLFGRQPAREIEIISK
jgi:hypothetical protein